MNVRCHVCFLDGLEEAAGQDHVAVGEVATWVWRAKESVCLPSQNPLKMRQKTEQKRRGGERVYVERGGEQRRYLSTCGDDDSGGCFCVDEACFDALGGIKVSCGKDPFTALEVGIGEHVKDITYALCFSG
jgi:hypothetical protein